MPFIDTREIPVQEPLPGWKGHFFNSQNMTFAHYDVAAGAAIHPHSHPQRRGVAHHRRRTRSDHRRKYASDWSGFGRGCAARYDPSVNALTDGRAIVVDHPLRASIGGVRVS